VLLEWIGFIALIFGGIIFVLAGVAFMLSYRFSGKYFAVGGLQIVAGVTLLVAAWRNKPFLIVFGG
jgi:hypothetical protein